MGADPLTRLAKLRIVSLSQQLETLLNERRGGNIVIEIVRRLRDRAADSMTALATCNFSDPVMVATLQNEVKRYDEFMGCLRDIVQEGMAFDEELTKEERDEMFSILVETPEGIEEARRLGLILEEDA